MKDLTRKNIQRIVVRGTNWVGDAVIAVPALRRLRKLFPDAHITLVVRPSAEGLFTDVDFVDSLLIYHRKGLASVLQQIRQWRREDFDLAILFQNAFEAALIAFLARVPFRVGYATDGRHPLLTHPIPLPKWRDSKHETFYYLNIATQIERLANQTGSTGRDDMDCSLEVSTSRRTQAAELLRTAGAREDRVTIALCPGSINSRAKRWPADRYAQLADLLIKEREANILLIGSREEADVAAAVVGQMRNTAIDLTGRTSLAEAVAILSVVDLVVTNDTGPAHIASALGRPTLVIFGPTNPLTTRPFSDAAEIVRHPPDCAPCMLRDCPIDHRCMTAISVEEVLTKGLALLAGSTLAELPGLKTIERNIASAINR